MEGQFEALLAEVHDESVRQSFRKLWNEPPQCFKDENAEMSRHLMFWPSGGDGAKYAAMLEDKAMSALALCYALHGTRANAAFWTSFCLAGGICALGSLFESDDLYTRAHALELFLIISSMEELDWYEDKKLQDVMLELPISALLDQRFCETYPGGEMSALRAIAFWISWARFISPHKDEFKVSRTLLSSLSDWVDRAAERGDVRELELAQTLFDDFSRHDIHDGLDLVFGCFNKEIDQVLAPNADGVFDLCTETNKRDFIASEIPASNEKPITQIYEARDKGNRFFAEGEYTLAIEEYSKALKEVMDDTKKSAQILCNRAMCQLRLGVSHLAVEDCSMAIMLDSSSAKAQYRLAQSLRSTGDLWSAARAAKSALKLLPVDVPTLQQTQTQDLLVTILEEAARADDRHERAAASERRKANLVAKLAKRGGVKSVVPKSIPRENEKEDNRERSVKSEDTGPIEHDEKDSDDDDVLLLRKVEQRNSNCRPSIAHELLSNQQEPTARLEMNFRYMEKKKVPTKKNVKISKKDQVAQVLQMSLC